MNGVVAELPVPSTVLPTDRVPSTLAYVTRKVVIALLILFWQIGSVAFVSYCIRSESLFPARWDALWYCRIVREGYQVPPVQTEYAFGNVGFFPGFPLLQAGVARLTGLDIPLSGRLASQIACALFWTYMLLLMDRWRIGRRQQCLGVAFILTFPSHFFVVMGYSEPLFLAALVGMIYWMDRQTRWGDLIGAVHGFVMTGTRIVGAPLAIYPILKRLADKPKSQQLFSRVFLRGVLWSGVCGVVIASGTLLFFVYCQVKFGHWDEYFITERIGWYEVPDYFFLFKSSTYVPKPFLHFGLNSNWLSKVSVPGMMLLFLGLCLREFRRTPNSARQEGLRMRVGIFVMSWLIFYVSVASKSRDGMGAVIRYALPVVVLQILLFLHQSVPSSHGRPAPSRFDSWWATGLFCLYFVCSYLVQLLLIYRFVDNQWVA